MSDSVIKNRIKAINDETDFEAISNIQIAEVLTLINNDKATKRDINAVISGFQGQLLKSTSAPSEGWRKGFYILIEDGTYTNITPNITTLSSKLNLGIYDNGLWSLKAIDIPSIEAIDGFGSSSATASGSAKNDKRLYEALTNLRFAGESIIIAPPVEYDSFIDYKTSANIASYTNDGTTVKVKSNVADFATRAMIFSGTRCDVTFDAGYGDEVIIFGKAIQNATQLVGGYMKTGQQTLEIYIFDVTGTYRPISFPTEQIIDRTKTISFDFSDSILIKVFQSGVFMCQFTRNQVYFDKPACGIISHDKLEKIYTYKLYGTNPKEPEEPTDLIKVNTVTLATGTTSADYKKVIYQENTLKIVDDVAVDGEYPFANKTIVLFGDSISVNTASSAYESKMKLKTKCNNIIRVGQGGQSFAGDLSGFGSQINARNPDLVIIHVTNDHRNNEVIGDLNSPIAGGTTVGGLRKILTEIIAYNKNVKIILCTPLTAGGASGLPASDQTNAQGKFMVDYAEAMIRVARVYGVALVDLASECGFRPRVEETTGRVYTDDGVHPISVGYEVMTSIIAKKVNSMI